MVIEKAWILWFCFSLLNLLFSFLRGIARAKTFTLFFYRTAAKGEGGDGVKMG